MLLQGQGWKILCFIFDIWILPKKKKKKEHKNNPYMLAAESASEGPP